MKKKVEIQNIYPLSPMQDGMLAYSIMHKGSKAFLEQFSFSAKGILDVELFDKSINALIERYDVLRTIFTYKTVKRPLQVVIKQRITKVHFEDISHLENNKKHAYISSYKEKELTQGFDLCKDILLRVAIFKTGSDSYKVIWTFHHIILDGWCINLIMNDFFQIYHSIKLEMPIQLDAVIPYSNYISCIEKKQKQEADEFWFQYLKDYKPMHFNEVSGKIKNLYKIQEHAFTINSEETKLLSELAKRNNVTLYTLLKTVYGLVLQKKYKTDDIIFGSVVSGRNIEVEGIEKIVGLFINTVPVRIKCKDKTSFVELLRDTQTDANLCSKHDYFPMYNIKVESTVKKEINYYMHIMVYENYPVDEVIGAYDIENLTGFSLGEVEFFEQIDYDLNIIIRPGNEITVKIKYNLESYNIEDISNIENNFNSIIKHIIKNEKEEVCLLKSKNNQEDKSTNTLNSKLNVAISATFTVEPIEKYIRWCAEKLDDNYEIKFAPYNQVFKELTLEDSLISNNLGINILLIRFEDWVRYDNSSEKYQMHKLDELFEELISVLKHKEKRAPYFIGIFPVFSQLCLSAKVEQHIKEMYEKLRLIVAGLKAAYIIDFVYYSKIFGVNEIFNFMSDKSGHIPFTDKFYALMGTSIVRNIFAWKNQLFKVIVLDCDNTLWDGVCGETGSYGISIDEHYAELQKFILRKYNEGMLIALCSKNNEKDVWDVFDTNPNMILKREHIVASKINWNSKVQNIKEISDELGLSLESFIFIDDSKVECIEMMTHCPEVLTFPLPEKVEYIPILLKHIWAFDKVNVTKEDLVRTQMYIQDKKRKELMDTSNRYNEFLAKLKIKVSMNFMKEDQIDRVVQLMRRTNQFNLNGIRRSENEIKELIKNQNCKCWTIEVADKFGEYGLVGVLLTTEQDDKLIVDSFLLSCRVLGRNVENSILMGMKKFCQENMLLLVEANYYNTNRNKPIVDFFEKTGWRKEVKDKGHSRFLININDIDDRNNFTTLLYKSQIHTDIKRNIVEHADNNMRLQEIEDTKFELQGLDFNYIKDSMSIYSDYIERLLHKRYYMPINSLTQLGFSDRDNKSMMSTDGDQHTEDKILGILSNVLNIEFDQLHRIDDNEDLVFYSMNSILGIQIVVKLEQEFNFEVDEEELLLENINTISKIKKLVYKYTN